ncbi:MAG: hypothetical protein V3S64_04540 [bacterium]
MSYLFVAVLLQVWNANLLKIGESRGQQRMVVIGFNYISATAIAAVLWAVEGGTAPAGITWIFGPVAGFFYATSLFFFMVAIARSGLALSTAGMRLSVLWPVLLSLIAFGEVPTALQWSGIGLTLAVMALLGRTGLRESRSADGGLSGRLSLLALFLCMGGGLSTLKAFTEMDSPANRSAMLALLFASAGIMCWAVIAVGPAGGMRRIRGRDALLGLLFGVGNVAANSFLLLGLEQVAGVVAFPLVNISVILLNSLSGVLLWRERLGRVESAAVAVATLAIVLMTV